MTVTGRLASFALALLGASLVVFALLDLLPGNASAVLLGINARPDTVAALQAQLGLDRPAPLRYLAWIGGAFTGDLGRSVTYGVPAGGLIADRLAVTLPLAGLALLLAVAVGVGAGVMSASRAGSAADRLVTVVAQVAVAVPDFWVGLLLVLLFSSVLRWFPAGGFPGWDDPPAAARALLLPAVALALPQAAVLSRVTRAAVLDALGEDFIRTARAKGLPWRRVLWRHAVPNVLPPVATIVGLQSSFLVAGAVLVETVFNLPGVGRLAAQALAQRDLVVIRSVAMLFAAMVMTANLLVDLLIPWFDPRLRAPR